MAAIELFTSKHFLEVLRENLPNHVARKTCRCPDHWVGDVEWAGDDGGFHFVGSEFNYERPLESPLVNPPSQRLIIVLESPHSDEFEPELDRAIGPAAGNTGATIRTRLRNVTAAFANTLSGRMRGRRYALILMNAVPYQCSLGEKLTDRSNTKIRDDIFRWCWASGADKYFQARLSSYLTKDSLVVNACTRGVTKGSVGGHWLRNLVDDKILETLQAVCRPELPYLRRLHPGRPTNWSSEKGW